MCLEVAHIPRLFFCGMIADVQPCAAYYMGMINSEQYLHHNNIMLSDQ